MSQIILLGVVWIIMTSNGSVAKTSFFTIADKNRRRRSGEVNLFHRISKCLIMSHHDIAPEKHMCYLVNKHNVHILPPPTSAQIKSPSCCHLGSAVNCAQPVSTLTSSCSRRGRVGQLGSSKWFWWWIGMLIFDGFSKLWPLINNAAYQRVLSDVTYERVYLLTTLFCKWPPSDEWNQEK